VSAGELIGSCSAFCLTSRIAHWDAEFLISDAEGDESIGKMPRS